MSDETFIDPNCPKTLNRDTAQAISEAIIEVTDQYMNMMDKTCEEKNFDFSSMIYLSVGISGNLMARGLFGANGPEARQMLKTKMLDKVSEILDSASEHIDRSERELNSGIIRPN